MGFWKELFSADPHLEMSVVEEHLASLLLHDEHLIAAYKVVGRTFFVLTEKRIILHDVESNEKKILLQSIPYQSITSFAVESPRKENAPFNVKLWIMGHPVPIEKTIVPGSRTIELQQHFAQLILP